jgi:hypothetical protein
MGMYNETFYVHNLESWCVFKANKKLLTATKVLSLLWSKFVRSLT